MFNNVRKLVGSFLQCMQWLRGLSAHLYCNPTLHQVGSAKAYKQKPHQLHTPYFGRMHHCWKPRGRRGVLRCRSLNVPRSNRQVDVGPAQTNLITEKIRCVRSKCDGKTAVGATLRLKPQASSGWRLDVFATKNHVLYLFDLIDHRYLPIRR